MSIAFGTLLECLCDFCVIFNFYHVLDSSLWYLGISSLLFYVFSIFLIKIFIDFDGLDLEFDTFLIMRSPIGFGVFTVQFSWFLTKSKSLISILEGDVDVAFQLMKKCSDHSIFRRYMILPVYTHCEINNALSCVAVVLIYNSLIIIMRNEM